MKRKKTTKRRPRVLAFTATDLSNLDVALRCRIEACEENEEFPEERREGRAFKLTHGKVVRLMGLLK